MRGGRVKRGKLALLRLTFAGFGVMAPSAATGGSAAAGSSVVGSSVVAVAVTVSVVGPLSSSAASAVALFWASAPPPFSLACFLQMGAPVGTAETEADRGRVREQ